MKGINNLKISSAAIRNGCNREETYQYKSLSKVLDKKLKEIQFSLTLKTVMNR